MRGDTLLIFNRLDMLLPTMENTYLLLLILIAIVLVFVIVQSYHAKTTLAQTSVPPTKINLTNATSMNTTKSTGNLTNSLMNSTG
jgi:hypothetical protein